MLLRLVNWQAARQAIFDSPLFGHGFLNEAGVLFEYLGEKKWQISSAHQQYLSFAIASGIPGLIAGCNFLLLPVWLLLKTRKSYDRFFAAMSLSLPIMLNGLVDTTFDDLRILNYFVVLSLTLATVRFETRTACG